MANDYEKYRKMQELLDQVRRENIEVRDTGDGLCFKFRTVAVEVAPSIEAVEAFLAGLSFAGQSASL